jgi:hypothetical protein
METQIAANLKIAHAVLQTVVAVALATLAAARKSVPFY